MNPEAGIDGVLSPLSTGLLLPDVVHNICLEGQALRWDHSANCYEVINGALFERRFDELRRKRGRDDGSHGRPFSRMHKYYHLPNGERWAKTGVRFSPKDPLLLRRLQAQTQLQTVDVAYVANSHDDMSIHMENAEDVNAMLSSTILAVHQDSPYLDVRVSDENARAAMLGPDALRMQEHADQVMHHFHYKQENVSPSPPPPAPALPSQGAMHDQQQPMEPLEMPRKETAAVGTKTAGLLAADMLY